MGDFILELYSEEIPAKMQLPAREQIERLFNKNFEKFNVKADTVTGFVTPMRLGVITKNLNQDEKGKKEEIRGPRVGAPDIAIKGFLKKNNIMQAQLIVKETEKGDFYVYEREIAMTPLSEILQRISTDVISEFSWPKSMLWGSDYSLRWVRPLKSILAVLFIEKERFLIPVEVRGLKSNVLTRGHSFMSPENFQFTSVDDYQNELIKRFVILQPQDRQKRISEISDRIVKKEGFKIVEDLPLLDELTGLSEFPSPILGEIPVKYLDLPEEVIITAMREHQKFISLRKKETGRVEGFLVISNVLTPDKQKSLLRGNVNVLNARLADALFFYNNDKNKIDKFGMSCFYEDLKKVRFHEKLGSQYDRVSRISEIAVEMAKFFGEDPKLISNAATLIKADLVSEMVTEFPSLQGVMGSKYSKLDGYPVEIANAAREHYSPIGPNDSVPTGNVSIILAISDKLEYLTAFWSIGIKPTGSKDPFALRRASLGIIRIIIENRLKLNLSDLLCLSMHKIDKNDLLSFFRERVVHYLVDLGYEKSVTLSVVYADNLKSLYFFPTLIEKIENYIKSADGARILAMNKRASNILNGFSGNINNSKKTVSELGVKEDFELLKSLRKTEKEIENGLRNEDFDQIIQGVSLLVTPLNNFFEKVQINCQNQDLRLHRYKFLFDLQRILKRISIFSHIELK
ncbi:glycine--tRNA ligase subunit beta [bacterium TMED277]|nr:MAG: glycine--tRNA ligase subunit beta [bacterium TMED277]